MLCYTCCDEECWNNLLSNYKIISRENKTKKKAANIYLRMGDFNERQAQIIKLYADDSTALITIKDLQVKFGISPTTAKNDIIGLLKKNIITEIALNKVKRAYIRGEGLDSLLSQ